MLMYTAKTFLLKVLLVDERALSLLVNNNEFDGIVVPSCLLEFAPGQNHGSNVQTKLSKCAKRDVRYAP